MYRSGKLFCSVQNTTDTFCYSQLVFKGWPDVDISTRSILADTVQSRLCKENYYSLNPANLNSVNISIISPSAVTSPASVALGLKGNKRCYVCASCCKKRILRGGKKLIF